MPFKIISIFIGATLNGKNMLPMESIFIPFLICGFLDIESYFVVQNSDIL